MTVKNYFDLNLKDKNKTKNRALTNNLKIIRYPSYIAKYKMLFHEKDAPSKQRYFLSFYSWILQECQFFEKLKIILLAKSDFKKIQLHLIFLTLRLELLASARQRFRTDGLNSLDYLVLNRTVLQLYTRVLVWFKINLTNF